MLDLADEVLKFPRHLGIHSGGMVLTDRPVGEVCPIEHARMDGRTVLQWDKEDCAWMGLVKFDLLGLGMLAALQYCFDLVREHTGEAWALDTLPREEQGVYDMLCRADSIGVFQVESRAQMGVLPRLQPRRFYDLVIEIALVRPGPIQGGAVHPYVRRKLGKEPVTYLHPLLEPVLERTLGVPLFQEQLMQVAMAVGGCSAEDADLLRRAMGSKRGIERISSLKTKLYAGMADNGIVGGVADEIYEKIEAFANFGFAESHSLSFALLVYASSWLKLHYPGAFLAALLRAQPMGFYSPQTLVGGCPQARRRGAPAGHPALRRGRRCLSLLDADRSPLRPAHRFERAASPSSSRRCRRSTAASHSTRPSTAATARSRCGSAWTRSPASAPRWRERIVAEREASGDFRDMSDLVRRTLLTTAQLEALAAAGAFDSFGLSRREALWNAGNAAQDRPEYLPHSFVAVQPPLFSMPSELEEVASRPVGDRDLAHRSSDPSRPRRRCPSAGVLSSAQLATAESGRRVEVGGVVTHRQRPATASGITFLNLEDETGLTNVICSVGVWNRYRRVARDAPALIVRGKLERSAEGVTNILADRFEPLALVTPHRSRDFR